MDNAKQTYLSTLNTALARHRDGGHPKDFARCDNPTCDKARANLKALKADNPGLTDADLDAHPSAMVSLATIAKKMNLVAEKTPWHPGMKLAPFRKTLARGLMVTRYDSPRDARSILALAREGRTLPSEQEEKILRAAFDVPHSAERTIVVNDERSAVLFKWLLYTQKELMHTVK